MNSTLAPIDFKIFDAHGRPVRSHRPLTVRLTNVGPQDFRIDGPATVTTGNGGATFDTLVPRTVGATVLEITAPGLPQQQRPLRVFPGTPVSLRVVSQPPQLDTWRPAVGLTLELLDRWGNRATQDNSSEVVARIATGSGMLGGTVRARAQAGVIPFGALRIAGEGPVTLGFETTGNTVLRAESSPIPVKQYRRYANAFDPFDVQGFRYVLAPPQIADCGSALAHLPETVSYLREALAPLPPGQKNLFFREMCQRDRGLFDTPSDYIRTPSGELAGTTDQTGHFTPFGMGLWWDDGAARIRDESATIFAAFKEGGISIDRVILSAEQSISNWALPSGLERWQAMQNDPRYHDPEYGYNGVSLFDLLSFHTIYPHVYDWLNPLYRGNYLEFNELMRRRTDDYYNRAVTEPVLSSFPNALISRYNTGETSLAFGLPDQNGHPQYLYSELFPGSPLGTAQAQALHACGGQVFNPTRGPGGITYPDTPFNRFRFYANQARSMRLSSQLPLSPWINYSGHPCSASLGELYEELIWHALLAGAESFSYWNPHQEGASRAQVTRLDALLAEFDTIVGSSAYRAHDFQDLSSWTSDYMETCATFDRDSVCRLTLKLPSGESAPSHVVGTAPLQILVGNQTLTLPGRAIIEMPATASQSGLWLRRINN